MQIAALRLVQGSGSKRGKTYAWEWREQNRDEKEISEQINFKNFKKLRDQVEKGQKWWLGKACFMFTWSSGAKSWTDSRRWGTEQKKWFYGLQEQVARGKNKS